MTHRAELVAEWARAIADTSYVSLSAAQLEVFAGGLTDTLVTLLDEPAYDAAAARRIGEAMIAAHCTGADTLQRTVVLLGDRLPDLRPSIADRRVSRIIGDVAAGYAAALRERTLAEQDAIAAPCSRPSAAAEQALARQRGAVPGGVHRGRDRHRDRRHRRAASSRSTRRCGHVRVPPRSSPAATSPSSCTPTTRPSVWRAVRRADARRAASTSAPRSASTAPTARCSWTNLTVSLHPRRRRRTRSTRSR